MILTGKNHKELNQPRWFIDLIDSNKKDQYVAFAWNRTCYLVVIKSNSLTNLIEVVSFCVIFVVGKVYN